MFYSSCPSAITSLLTRTFLSIMLLTLAVASRLLMSNFLSRKQAKMEAG
ncbi:hypothetical protein [Cedecea colo]|nr:hypothetical protein [Cedecea colo]